MTQTKPNRPAPAALISLPGTLLSAKNASPERGEIFEVSMEMLPLQHAKHLENYADNFGEGWFDPNRKQLRLQFNLVVLFANARTEGLWLTYTDKDERVSLSPSCVASPGIRQKYLQLSWAAQSRFAVDEVIELPDWASESTQFELVVGVAGKPEKVGLIRVGEVYVSPDKSGRSSEGSPTTSIAEKEAASEKPVVRAVPLLSKPLQVGGIAAEQPIRNLSVTMLPLQHLEHLANIVDNLGVNRLDPQNNKLHLQFHLITLFGNAKIEKFWISVPGRNIKIALNTACMASPVIGQKFAAISWAAQSRFVVDEIIDLPEDARNLSKFELMVEVAGKLEKIGIISGAEASSYTDNQRATDIEATKWPAKKSSSTVAAEASSQELEVLAADPTVITSYTRVISKRVKRLDRLFLFTVVLPTLISIVYFGFIASDVYVSESRFVVRSPQHQTSSMLSSLIQGGGFSSSQDDSYAVHDYIFSRDALKQLDTQFGLGKEFSSYKVDIFSRFAGLDWDTSFEALYLYFQKHVALDLDTSSSISTLSVRTFSPETAYQVNEKLLEMSESLVNQLNERGRQDMLAFAKREVLEAERKDREATLDLARIQTGSTKLTARGDSLINRLTEFQRLTLEKEFADKMLAMAMNSLEQARNDAGRQQLYLERIGQPSKPDVATEPRRIRNIFATLMLGMIAWGILTMLLAGIREHQD